MPHPDVIMGAFQQFRKEARIIGQLLTSYGEIEFRLAVCAGKALGDQNIGLRTIFGMQGEKNRIRVASGLARDRFISLGLGPEFAAAIKAVDGCRVIRNQFAHAHYASADYYHTLFFTDLEAAADTDEFEYLWHHIDIPLLSEHLRFFSYAGQWLLFFENELDLRTGKIQNHIFPMPKEREPPKPHNPLSQHVPHWLSPTQKARHVELARAIEAGDPTPTQAHKAMEAKREAARARRQADRDASKRSRPEPQQ